MKVNRGENREMSLALSEVLEDIAINEEVIKLRRHVYSFRDNVMQMLNENLSFPPAKIIFFIGGSQPEGSTTYGMLSDVDQVCVHKFINVCLNVADYKENMKNVLAMKDDTCLPQCCLLQFLIKLGNNTPKPAYWTNSEDINLVKEQFRGIEKCYHVTGQICMTNTWQRVNLANQLMVSMDKVSYSGPAVNIHTSNYVLAIQCENIPECCEVIFNRPRPGHWPKPETLKKLRKQYILLVSNEPPIIRNACIFKRDQNCGSMIVKEHANYLAGVFWRYSTNFAERCLMFDLSIVQMKAYVVTKMIRKELFVPIIGNRLSTFHFKTVLLFTIELFPPDIWTGNNLVACVIECLLTLKRFLKRQYCPHYTISGVNLFADKLSTHEYAILIQNINWIIINNLICLFEMKLDNIGERLKQQVHSTETVLEDALVLTKFRKTQDIIVSFLLGECCFIYFLTALTVNDAYDESSNLEARLVVCGTKLQTAAEETPNCPEFHMYSHIMYSFLASIVASSCIDKQQAIPKSICEWYQSSLSSDFMCNRLKYASFLYCIREFNEAAIQLDIIHDKITPSMLQKSPPRPRQMLAREPKTVRLPMPLEELIRRTAMCIYFSKKEINCIPWLLKFEMFRTVTPADKEEKLLKPSNAYMDLAVMDSIPFLYYLQYLTFRGLGDRIRQIQALQELSIYRKSENFYRNKSIRKYTIEGYMDTTLNMLGHCLELEGRVHRALRAYAISMEIHNHNNAAVWHILRLLQHKTQL